MKSVKYVYPRTYNVFWGKMEWSINIIQDYMNETISAFTFPFPLIVVFNS